MSRLRTALRSVAVRLPAPRGREKRLQEISTHSTMTSSLTELAVLTTDVGDGVAW
jgi:hypothetical protein